METSDQDYNITWNFATTTGSTTPYWIHVGAEGYKAFVEALKQYPYTPEKSPQKQEEPELGFLGLVTITNKNEK